MENADDRLIKTLTRLDEMSESLDSIAEVESRFDKRLKEMESDVEGLFSTINDISGKLDALSGALERLTDAAKRLSGVQEQGKRLAELIGGLDPEKLSASLEESSEKLLDVYGKLEALKSKSGNKVPKKAKKKKE